MGTIVILLCQAFDVGTSAAVEELPRFSDMEWSPPHGAEERISVEAFAVWTRFDPGIRMDDTWGYGVDVKAGLDWGTPVTLNGRFGYAGWNTDNDDQQTFSATSRIRQYRIGVGADFATRHITFGIYANAGFYHFHSKIENDTRSFFEIEATIGYKPLPFLKIGVVGMVTWTNSDFNRASSHLFTNHSIGPSIEVIF